jgi:NhaP-type Na+/H+ or K+/H+ antiporter
VSFLGWITLCGGLLLLMALSSAWIRRLPVSAAVIYLVLGLAIGPLGTGWLRIDAVDAAPWLERLTEIAVIVSLFVGGLKLRLPLRDPAWRAAWLLAGPVMVGCIAGVATFAHLALGLDLASSLLLGAVLAPTDPVLASTVTVDDARDFDRVRYGLSGEAGLNDGMAFPFVVFALAWGAHAGGESWIAGWALHRLLWAVPAGLCLGFALGHGVGRLAVWLRSIQRDTNAPSDFLALALIALSYVGAEAVGAWGFLAAFASGVGLRHAELRVVADAPFPALAREAAARPPRAGEAAGPLHPPAEELLPANVAADDLGAPAIAAGVLVAETLSFGDTVERLLEVMLVVLVGTSLAVHWDLRAVPLAAALFLGIRPLATLVFLARTPTTRAQRWLIGWFGIRGIGSLYYASHAIRLGLPAGTAADLADLTISVVALSVVVHGITTTPLLDRYERKLGGRRSAGRAS